MKLFRTTIGAIALIISECIILPFQIIAVLIVAHHMITVSARLNTSMSALKILEGRLLMHWFGLRNDPYSLGVAKHLPNYAVKSLLVAIFPLFVFYYVAGWSLIRIPRRGDEVFKELVYSRTEIYDEIMKAWCTKMKKDGYKAQFVHLGAGYDTRSLHLERFDFQGKRFEVDHARVQTIKRKAYEKSETCRASAKENITFIAVDFNKEGDWTQKLLAAGFDPQQPTLMLWEGVTLYLQESAVYKTLAEIRQLCQSAPANTCVLLTGLYSTQLIDCTYDPKLKKSQKILAKTGEAWTWGLPFASNAEWEKVLRKFVVGTGFELGAYAGLGSNNPKGPYLVCTEMIVPGESSLPIS